MTLELLLAEREIHRLMIRYLDRIDARDHAGIAPLFTDDAVADFLTGRTYHGPERIAGVLGRITAQFERTSHHLTNHLAEVDLTRGEATAVTYVYAFHRMADSGRPWHFWGRHVDRLRRVDGAWLLADRRLVGVDSQPVRDEVPAELFAGHATVPGVPSAVIVGSPQLDAFSPTALRGRVALITGGGTGMGAAIAEGYAALGAAVAVLSRNPDNVGAVAALIEERGGRALPIVCDVRDPERVAGAVAEVEQRFGGLDILVNSAAGNFRCAADDLSPNAWRTVVEIDLNGTFFCSQAAAPALRRRGRGVILNMIGDFVETHGDRMAHAAAAKAGIWNLTRSLAKEWGSDGIRVNAIAPGPFETDGGSQALGRRDAFAEIAAALPLGRVGELEEIVAAAVFLACDAATFITGATLTVDGGHSWSGYHLP